MDEAQAVVNTQLTHSSSIGSLAGALAKAQAEYKPVLKNAVNPFFKSKYADHQAVIDATKDALSKNGLSVTQLPSLVDKGLVEVSTLLMHSSGEWVKSVLRMPTAKPDAQGVGAAITYARRYAHQSIIGVAAEEDDDGNAATGKESSSPVERSQGTRTAPTTTKAPERAPMANTAQEQAIKSVDKRTEFPHGANEPVESWWNIVEVKNTKTSDKKPCIVLKSADDQCVVLDKTLFDEASQCAGNRCNLRTQKQDMNGKSVTIVKAIRDIEAPNPAIQEIGESFGGEE